MTGASISSRETTADLVPLQEESLSSGYINISHRFVPLCLDNRILMRIRSCLSTRVD